MKKDFLDSFEGNYKIFILLFIAGIFIPPFLGISAVYLLAKRYEDEPKFIDNKFFSYIIIFISAVFLLGLTEQDVFKHILLIMAFSLIFAIITYIPLFYWVKFDYDKHKKRIRNIYDTKLGKTYLKIKKTVEKIRYDLKKDKKRFKTKKL